MKALAPIALFLLVAACHSQQENVDAAATRRGIDRSVGDVLAAEKAAGLPAKEEAKAQGPGTSTRS